MKQQRLCYYYELENVADVKSLLQKVGQIQGVVYCTEENNVLMYELNEWADEYDVLTQTIAICQDLGGDLIIPADDTADDYGLTESQTVADDTQGGQTQTGDQALIADFDTTENAENAENGEIKKKKFAFQPVEEEFESLAIQRKKLKNDLIIRLGELAFALVLWVLGAFVIKADSASAFTPASLLMIVGFAVSVYELLYLMIEAVTKKCFYDSSVVMVLVLVLLVFFGGLKHATFYSILYSIYKSIVLCSKRHRELLLGELNDLSVNNEEQAYKLAKQQDAQLEEEFAKSNKFQKIVGYSTLIMVFLSLLALIPALNLMPFALLYLSVVAVIAIGAENPAKQAIINARVYANYCDVNFESVLGIKHIASANALEIDVSEMMTDGSVKQDVIGAMKELKGAGVVSLHTNFNVDVSTEVKSQVDFAETQMKNKRVLQVGKDKDVSFYGGKYATLNDEQMYKIPQAYKMAKRAKNSWLWSLVLSRLSFVFGALTIVLNFTGFASYVMFGAGLAIFMVVIAGLLGLNNFTNC